MELTNTTEAAFHAIRAVSIRATCGAFAARRYARKHGVMSLYRLACQLDAAAGF